MPAPHDPLVLAVDIGTSSVRTALFDLQGGRLAGSLAQKPHAVSHSPEGAAELDPAVLESGFLACLRETLPHARRRPVAAVGISCFWHSLVGTDDRGKALTPIYTWADSRCREDAARLRVEHSERDYHARTGCMLRASYWPAKLRWLAREKRGLFRRVRRWQSPAESLLGKLCTNGSDVCAYGMATGTGLFNPSTLQWEPELLEWCGLRQDQVPPRLGRCADVAARIRAPLPATGAGALVAGHRRRRGGQPRLGRDAGRPGGNQRRHERRFPGNARRAGGEESFRPVRLPGGCPAFRGRRRGEQRGQPAGLVPPGTQSTEIRARARRGARGAPGAAEFAGHLAFLVCRACADLVRGPGRRISGLSQNTTALDILQSTTEGVYHRLAAIADLSLPGNSAPGEKSGGSPGHADHRVRRRAQVGASAAATRRCAGPSGFAQPGTGSVAARRGGLRHREDRRLWPDRPNCRSKWARR